MAEMAKRKTRYDGYGRVPYTAYDGSAARQLEREEVLRPRPAQLPRERALERPKVRVREAGQVSVFAVVGFLAVGMFAVLLLLSYVQLAQTADQVGALRSQMTELRTEEARLRAQYELAYDLTTVERSMTGSGAMVKPQEGQIFYVDLSEPDSVTFFREDKPVKGVAGALESIKEICGDVVEYFK